MLISHSVINDCSSDNLNQKQTSNPSSYIQFFFSKAEEANANVHTGSDVFFDLFDQHQEGEATFDVKL